MYQEKHEGVKKMEYTIGNKQGLPEWGIKAVSFEDGKAIVSFDDGQESFIEDTMNPFEIEDLKELVNRRPELAQAVTQDDPQQEVAPVTYNQAEELAQAFATSEHTATHEIATALASQVRPVNSLAAESILTAHRMACREHYLRMQQEICCYGRKEEDARQEQVRQFQSKSYPENQWH